MMIKEYTTSEYHGFRRIDFSFAGYTGIVIFPETPAAGNPWVWRAEFLGAFDSVDVEMLRRGWYLVHYSISDMFGSPASVALMKNFYDFVVPAFALSEKCDIFGFSRGGLYAFNFTCAHPACVSTLYLDAPVLDMRDWPCADKYEGDFNYTECPKQYGMTRADFFAAEKLHPVDRCAELMKTGVPVALVAGDADSVVDFRKNGRRLCDALYSAGYPYMEIVKPGCDHHPHSVEDPAPVADFIAEHRN
ncbi:MAG: prolyl oligopeptidase family serine peptidase [Clostridia bacterium]|nr:prolyl oligopeptidase family serine peptidase [Clostridia bacterium]